MRGPIVAVVALTALAATLPVVAGAAPKPKPKPGPTPDLSIAATPTTTIYRQATVISGRLKGKDSAGKTVTLRGDRYPFTGDEVVGSTVTNSGGKYSFTRRPSANTLYRTTVGAVRSAVVSVNVRIRLSLRVSDYTPRAGQLIRVKGRACPAHDGQLVRIKRRTSTGGYRTVRRTRLREATRCSVYSRRFRIHRDGFYRVTTDDADHAKGISRRRFIDVHR